MNLKKWFKGWFLFGEAKKRHRALQQFVNTSWCEIDLNPYRKRFRKSTSSEHEDNLKQDLRIRISSGHGEDEQSPGPYRDASYTIALYERNEATKKIPTRDEYLACIGFDVVRNRVIVTQIQGSRGKRKTLSLVKWERMLLAILIDWAKKNKFRQIKVIRAKDQNWYQTHRAQQMFMHYDVTARRSGFSFDSESNQYVKTLV